MHALRSYLYLVGLRSQAWDDSRLNGDALALDTKGNNVPTPPVNGSVFQRLVDESISSDSKHATLASSRGDGVESESTRDILNVLLSAVRMYCDCLQNGPAAVEMAELAKRKWDRLQDHLKVQWIRLGAHVERNLGAAYGLLAHQSKIEQTCDSKVFLIVNPFLISDGCCFKDKLLRESIGGTFTLGGVIF